MVKVADQFFLFCTVYSWTTFKTVFSLQGLQNFACKCFNAIRAYVAGCCCSLKGISKERLEHANSLSLRVDYHLTPLWIDSNKHELAGSTCWLEIAHFQLSVPMDSAAMDQWDLGHCIPVLDNACPWPKNLARTCSQQPCILVNWRGVLGRKVECYRNPRPKLRQSWSVATFWLSTKSRFAAGRVSHAMRAAEGILELAILRHHGRTHLKNHAAQHNT